MAHRRERDFYPTPAAATRALLRRVCVPRGVVALECCAGAQDITRELRAAGVRVITNDIDGRSDLALDATRADTWARFPRVPWVITNPPFSHAAEIVRHAFEFTRGVRAGGVAALLRLSFLEPCDNRGPWLGAHPPSDVIVLPRISFTGDGKTDNVTCAWFVWRHRARPQRLFVVTKDELKKETDRQ